VTFRRSDPSVNYAALRWVSDSGRWELGFKAYHSGYRLRMGLAGRPPSLLDFCLGTDARLCGPVLTAVLDLLEEAPESSDALVLDALFPWAGTRPDMAVHLGPLLESATKREQIRGSRSCEMRHYRPRE